MGRAFPRRIIGCGKLKDWRRCRFFFDQQQTGPAQAQPDIPARCQRCQWNGKHQPQQHRRHPQEQRLRDRPGRDCQKQPEHRVNPVAVRHFLQ